jgi:hypothetical protein
MVLSCAVLNSYEPMRFAGTWKQYSKKAIPQLTRITFQSAEVRYFKWPYQANVMKIFEMVRRTIVRTRVFSSVVSDFALRNAFARNSDASQLGDLRGPQAANINSVSGHAVIDEPVSRMKPAMAAESPAFGSDGVHIREVF